MLFASCAFAIACGPTSTPLRVVGAAPPRAPVRAVSSPDPGYLHHVSGSPADVVVTTRRGLALLGGGGELDVAFRWMIGRSGGGDLVIVRASGGFDLDVWVHAMGGLDSAETLVVTSRTGADSDFVAERIRGAEVVFFAGGDQSHYVNLYARTALSRALDERLREGGIVLGGTSAGLAILGGVDYSAEHESLTSADALANPFHDDLTLSRDFLVAPGLEAVITDSHFARRDRMGRLVAMLARIQLAHWLPRPRAIGVDEGAALLVEPDGLARAVGGPTWLFEPTRDPEVCEPGRPLTHRRISVARLDPGATFDLTTWSPRSPNRPYLIDAKRGLLLSDAGNPYTGTP